MRASDISRGRQILSRFLALAEERLAHLTELYETGRWHLYFTRTELVENVRDAKNCVDTWKLLVSTEALANNRPVDLDWLNNGRPLPPRRHLLPDVEPQQLSPRFYEHRPEPDPEPAFEAVASIAVAADLLPPVAEPIYIERTTALPPVLMTPPAITAPVLVAPLPEPSVAPSLPVVESAVMPPWQNALDFTLMRERYPLLRKTG